MLPLCDVDQTVGGLEVIPDTHTAQVQQELHQKYPNASGDWVLFDQDKDICKDHGKLIKAKAGDMILFDSRLIHGGSVGTGKAPYEKTEDALVRLSLTVCMTDKKRASKEAIDKRIEMFEKGKATSHWPHEVPKCHDFCHIPLSKRTGLKKGYVH